MYLSNRVLVFSHRPGRILRDVTVPFGPGPERTLDLKLAPEFALLKRELFQLLHRSPRSTHALNALATKQGEHESC